MGNELVKKLGAGEDDLDDGLGQSFELEPPSLEKQCVRNLRAEVGTKFDPTEVKEHESLLRDIWQLFTGETNTFKITSGRWRDFGFQCDQPHTDVRGGGKLAVENLKYFLEHYPYTAQSMSRRQCKISQADVKNEKWYPFSTVGVNITDMVCRVTGIHSRGVSSGSNSPLAAALRGLRPSNLWQILVDEEAERDVCYGNPAAAAPPQWQKGFAEIYCIAFMLLDRNFRQLGASYMDFSNVLLITERQLTKGLHGVVGEPLQKLKVELQVFPRAKPPPLPPGPRPAPTSVIKMQPQPRASPKNKTQVSERNKAVEAASTNEAATSSRVGSSQSLTEPASATAVRNGMHELEGGGGSSSDNEPHPDVYSTAFPFRALSPTETRSSSRRSNTDVARSSQDKVQDAKVQDTKVQDATEHEGSRSLNKTSRVVSMPSSHSPKVESKSPKPTSDGMST